MGVEEFDVDRAPEADLRAVYGIWLSWTTTDKPADEPLTYEQWLMRRRGSLGNGWDKRRYLVTRTAGEITGFVEFVSSADAPHAVLCFVAVRPDLRRRGIGTALLRAAVPLMEGRSVIETWFVVKGGDGERWAAALGFKVAVAMTWQEQSLAQLPPVGAVPAGYELVSWSGAAPDHLVERYAAALDAMNDAPFGDTETAETTYSVEQVRADESTVLGPGGDIWVVLAMHGTEVAGLTAMHRHAYKPTWGEQRETVVLPAHRGHGLGRVMKAHLLHGVTGIDRVQTRTNSENAHMLRVNHSLGYVDMWTTLAVNAKITDLRL